MPTSLRAAIGAAVLLASLGLGVFLQSTLASAPEVTPPLETPFASPPLAPPLAITGGFCEYRVGHFHAGLDLGTGQRVGKPVLAPAGGHVERVRASGVGYGRSIYLKTGDGRLLQFGHLDAFSEPLASYVREQQDSSGQYEQDLWPPAGRFRFQPGEVMAWTGESGAGGPHLHFEVRRGDMAYHPFRAGLVTGDSTPPSLASLTLEPLDGESRVEGGVSPHTLRLTARPETLRVLGRARAVLGARDGVWRGVDRMVPWSAGLEWNGKVTECRFDSVSWATDMAEGDYVYDAGRIIGEKGVVLWAPPGFRPRVLRTDEPLEREAGTIEVKSGDPPRTLRLWALDLGGNRVERGVVLVASREPRGPRPAPRASAPRWEFASLPGGWLRVTYAGAPAGSRDVRFTLDGRDFAASASAGGWTCLLPPPGAGPRTRTLGVEGKAAGKPWVFATSLGIAGLAPAESVELAAGPFSVSVPRGALFEGAALLVRDSGAPGVAGELKPRSRSYLFGPDRMPLRQSVKVSLQLPAGGGAEGVGLYRWTDDGWDWTGATMEGSSRRFTTEIRRTGRYVLFEDRLAPRVTLRRVAPPGSIRPYSRWSLEAAVVERGSGVDARATWFLVDGKRVATEWDSEEKILRWRPARPPSAGSHRLVIVVADKAGNKASKPLRFRV